MIARPSSTEEAIGFSTSTCRPRCDAVQRDVLMQVGRRRDRDGVDAVGDQPVDSGKGPAADGIRDPLPTFRIGIDDADQSCARQVGKYAGVVAAHNADADHADAENPVRASFRGMHHG